MPQVEARGRLVEQQRARPVRHLPAGKLHQHPRQMDALLLAAGQCGDRSLAELGNIDFGKRGLDHLFDPRAACVARPHAHDLRDRERKGDADALGEHGAVLRQRLRSISGEFAAFQQHAPGSHGKLARDRPQQCRFAGPVGPDQCNYLAWRN